ncbi:MAG: hypothetical protein E6H53_15500 [Betaproteobacteria bacterium]|nr:MAG: hypothetical protein E6H53_15500 [Betaproteobacteria bacterium]
MTGAKSGRPLRVAIVGAGLMGTWHARYAVRAGAEIAAIVDRDAIALRRLGVRYPAAINCPDLPALLAAPLPDVAHVCSASGTHIEIAERLLARGVHVLVEKPLASSADETERLLQIADAHVALVCPVYQFPFQRGFELAQKRLATMGRAIRAEITICSTGADRLGADGDGLVREVLPHPPSILAGLFPDGRADLATWHATRPGEGECAAYGRFGTVHQRPCPAAAMRGAIALQRWHAAAGFLPWLCRRATRSPRSLWQDHPAFRRRLEPIARRGGQPRAPVVRARAGISRPQAFDRGVPRGHSQRSSVSRESGDDRRGRAMVRSRRARARPRWLALIADVAVRLHGRRHRAVRRPEPGRMSRRPGDARRVLRCGARTRHGRRIIVAGSLSGDALHRRRRRVGTAATHARHRRGRNRAGRSARGQFAPTRALVGRDRRGVHPTGGGIDVTLSYRQLPLGCCEYDRVHPVAIHRLAAGRKPERSGAFDVARLPGNNLAYRKSALRGVHSEQRPLLEMETNAALLAAGGRVLMHPDMAVDYRPGDDRGTGLGGRFRHGRLYGGMRARNASASRRTWWLLKAFLLPWVLSGRGLRAMSAALPHERWWAVGAWVCCMQTAWAIGEAVGYLAGPGHTLDAWV